MKKLFSIVLLLVIIPLTLYAQEAITIKPKVLQEKNKEVVIEFDYTINPQEIHRLQRWVVTPELRNGDKSLFFPSVVASGSRRQKADKRLKRFGTLDQQVLNAKTVHKNVNKEKSPINGSYAETAPYQAWMDKAELVFNHELVSCGGKAELTEYHTKNSPYQAIPEVYKPKMLVAYMAPDKSEGKNRGVESEAYLDFHTGRSVIIPQYRRNPEELAKIKVAMDGIKSKSDLKIIGVDIRGYASPEGKYESNLKLSQQRADALKAYIQKTFDVPADIIESTGGGEDWSYLRTLVEKSDKSYKQQLLSIINNRMDNDAKENQLKALGKDYQDILTTLYPELRRVTYKINFEVRDFSEAEAAEVFKRDPSLLSNYELHRLARSLEGKPGYDKVIQAMQKYYPESTATSVNTITDLVKADNPKEAEKWLKNLDNSPQALNSKGVVEMLNGNFEAAKASLEKAASLGSTEAKQNLEELKRKVENAEIIKQYKNRR